MHTIFILNVNFSQNKKNFENNLTNQEQNLLFFQSCRKVFCGNLNVWDNDIESKNIFHKITKKLGILTSTLIETLFFYSCEFNMFNTLGEK